MSKRKTHEVFVKEISTINPNIEIIGKYINARTKIKVRCLIDDHIWYATPDNLLHGYGCPKCAGKCRTTETFIKELQLINPNIEVLGEYKTNNTKIKCFCKIHNYIWYPTPSHLLEGQGCIYCKKEKISLFGRLSQEEFAKKLFNINDKIQIIGEYKISHTKILVKCKECGREWYIIPNNVLTRGVKCTCNKKGNISNGELLIFDALNKYNIEFIYQFSFNNLIGVNGGLLSYDFYLPNLNLLIEYQGIQHEKPIDFFGGKEKFKIQKQHDLIKKEYASQSNIDLLEIWYYDYNNIEKIIVDHLNINKNSCA